ncbi:hypothetical protein Cch01nite_21570 [Cellulomonas chitinilytica]|uniref:Uncharacterized protein n=1 Tax=Cellulomonas chitinilytica TaxID=398759 RepID=A0A919P3W2_9CELL|nr:hypothetical protein Cch01nite_21570 [Cellulomonas chitinilytica]
MHLLGGADDPCVLGEERPDLLVPQLERRGARAHGDDVLDALSIDAHGPDLRLRRSCAGPPVGRLEHHREPPCGRPGRALLSGRTLSGARLAAG